MRIKKEKPPLDKTEAKIQTNKKFHLEVQDDAGQVKTSSFFFFFFFLKCSCLFSYNVLPITIAIAYGTLWLLLAFACFVFSKFKVCNLSYHQVKIKWISECLV